MLERERDRSLPILDIAAHGQACKTAEAKFADPELGVGTRCYGCSLCGICGKRMSGECKCCPSESSSWKTPLGKGRVMPFNLWAPVRVWWGSWPRWALFHECCCWHCGGHIPEHQLGAQSHQFIATQMSALKLCSLTNICLFFPNQLHQHLLWLFQRTCHILFWKELQERPDHVTRPWMRCRE